MSELTLTRRNFIKACAAATVVSSTGVRMAYGSPSLAAAGHDTVVVIYLRGGIDGLNLIVPTAGDDRAHYEQARPNLRIPVTGDYAARPLTLSGGAASGFGLHPSAVGLHDIWLQGRLAVVHACGLSTVLTRSHFDAQLYSELGTPGLGGGSSGWMARAWATDAAAGGNEVLPALAAGSGTPSSLLGATDAITMTSPADFALNRGPWQWQRSREGSHSAMRGFRETLPQLWAEGDSLSLAGRRAHLALATVDALGYTGAPAGYPDSGFARQLWTIAQSIRFEMGLRYAAVDLGGWDTHDGQGTAGSGYHYYQNKIAELSQAVAAFYEVLAASGHIGRTTVVIQSEFGRRVRQNGNGGTDHGYGNPLLVLGGPVNGRRFYGNWPGLAPATLSPFFGDIPVTTDVRRVMSEILIRRMGNPHLSTVYPGYTGYSPLGLMQGSDQTPQARDTQQSQAGAALRQRAALRAR